MKDKVEELLTLVKNYDATLIGVSKRIELDRIIDSINCGITHVGESRVQELIEKVNVFDEHAVKKHFIGHL